MELRIRAVIVEKTRSFLRKSETFLWFKIYCRLS